MKRLALVLLPLLAVSMLFAAPPAWWAGAGTRIVEEEGEESNYAPANLGQLKHVAKMAKTHMDASLPGGSGTSVSGLVAGFVTGTTPEEIALNYAPLNLGQLKAVAKPFYDRLHEAGYDTKANLIARGFPDKWSGTAAWTGYYPWNPATPVAENYSPANIGQLKMTFSFDLTGFDSDEDGLPDGWEMAHFGSLGADDEGDADGDGLTNLAEFQQGSDPTDYYSQGSLIITPHLAKLSGDNQSGQPGQYFPNPLVVEVRSGSSTGAVLSNAPVAFAATVGGGGLSSEFDGSPVSPTLSITTGTDGRAQAFHQQGFAGGVSTVTATTGTASVSFAASSPLADGLWSRWPFSEGTGSVTADATNLTVSGTLVGGATWTERFTGQNALSFSGTGQFVSMGDAAALDLGEESFSVAFWVKYADAPSSGNTMRIVSKGNTNWGTGYFVGIRENGKLASGMGTASGTQANALLFRTTGTFNNNEWRHVAVVYNRTAATARIYVDGEAQELEKEAGTGGTASGLTLSYTGLEGLSASGTGSSFSVASSNGANDFFSGAVDDVRIYRKALSGAAVDNLRNADDDTNGLPDWWEARHLGAAGADPEADADEDGLSNIEEYYQGTNPADDDTDGDGMADGWEISFGFDPLDNADAAGDADGDGLTNLQEFQQESDPTDYYSQGSATVAPVLSIVSGNEQAGNTNAYLAEALTVEVRSGSSTGALLSNAPVTYSVAEGGGRLATAFGGTTTHLTLELRTGTNGQAAAWYKQGPPDREESTISVTSGTAAPVEFTAWTLDLVGHWKLDEGSGTTTADSGPFEFSGALVNGPQWSERYPGENALTFSGSNDHVLVASGTGGELDFEDASFTVTAWVKTGTAPAAGRILGKGNENSDPGYYLAVTADGQIETGLGTVHSGTAAETIRIKTTGSFNDDAWHAVAAVYDRANATARIYVDGTARQIAKEPGTGGTIAVSGSTSLNYPDLENLSGNRPDKDLTLASQSGTSAFFAGSLDETRLYRKALSAEEILDLHRQEGELTAVAGELTIPEDTLGTQALQSHGGGDAAATYEIVTTSTNGTTELSGASVNYYPNAHFSGTDSFRFRVTKGPNTAEADVAITVTPVNDPPLVSVGGGLSTTMSGSTATVSLTATVTDIDTDPEDITLTWMKASGTGTVTFSGTNPLAATATFDAPGEYTLRLSAFDGSSTRSDSLAVVVNPSGANALPTVTFEEPANNTAYDLAEPIVLKAEASAGTGLSVAKVEFYEGSRKIGAVISPDGTSGLYELSWTPPRLGAYRLSARVTDSAGGVSFSSSMQVRVTEAGWFTDIGTVAGNEGYTGSGGNGGASVGSSTGSSSNYGPGSGENGGGAVPGGGGDGGGNPAGTDLAGIDSDGDGLSDAEEDEYGTNKFEGGEDTDGDGRRDGEDAVPNDPDFSFLRILPTNYALIDLGEESQAVSLNNSGDVLVKKVESGTNRLYVWREGVSTMVPLRPNSVLERIADNGNVVGKSIETAPGESPDDIYSWNPSMGSEPLRIYEVPASSDLLSSGTTHSAEAQYLSGSGTLYFKKITSTWLHDWTDEGLVTHGGRSEEYCTLNPVDSRSEFNLDGYHNYDGPIDDIHRSDLRIGIKEAIISVASDGSTSVAVRRERHYANCRFLEKQGGSETNYNTTFNYSGEVTDYLKMGEQVLGQNTTSWYEYNGGVSDYPADWREDGYPDVVSPVAKLSDLEFLSQLTPKKLVMVGVASGNKTCAWIDDGGAGKEKLLYKDAKRTDVLMGKALAINKRGEVLVAGLNVWRNGKIFNLGEQVSAESPDFQLTELRAINDKGVVLGNAKKISANGNPIPQQEQKYRAVLLVPVELRTRSQATGREETSDGVVSASDPTPEVEMSVTSTEIDEAGNLVVVVEGKVEDALSEVLSSSRVQSLRFKVDGQEIGEAVSLTYNAVTDSPLRLADSETTFTRTLTITNPLPRGYTILAETDANAAGNRGWAKVVAGVDIEHRREGLPADITQLSIAFDQELSTGVVNTGKVYFGNRAPGSGDGVISESGVGTFVFQGDLHVGAQTAQCTLSLRPRNSSAGAVDYLEAEVIYTLPNKPAERITGVWQETGAGTLRFYPDGYVLGSARKFANYAANLPGNQKRSFEPLVMSVGASDAWVESDGFKIKVGEVDHTLKKFTYGGREAFYVVANDSASRPKIFVPSAKNLPAEVKVDGGSAENDSITWTMVLGGTDHELTETQVVADQAPFGEELIAASLQNIPASRLWVSNGGGGTAPSSNGMDWQQPGDTISRKDLLDAFNFHYPDELSQHMLATYLAEGHEIVLGDVFGDYDFDYWSRPGDAKARIEIEHDDGDMHPGIAAQYLWIGLNEALANVFSYRQAVIDGAGSIDVTIAAMEAWRAQAGRSAAEYGVAAAELYLSGIGILSEPLDWVLVVNDLSEGHYTALAAALPFVPRALVAGGRKLKIKSRSGEVLETFDTVEKLDAAKSLYRETDLRVMGVTMEQQQFSEFMRKAMAAGGGPVRVPTDRDGLRKAMRQSGLQPAFNVKAHHDFPWAQRVWFASRGVDVNNPAFGRWVSEIDHKFWHERAVPKFNKFWEDFIDAESTLGRSYTIDEIMQKLSDARGAYPVTNGN